jgi:predicted DNA binding CopG/RHH family protein
MQLPAPSQPSPNPPSFAGLLAALATPSPDTPALEAPALETVDRFWSDGDPAEDVATITYERALRTHSRYRSADLGHAQMPMAAPVMPVAAPKAARTQSTESHTEFRDESMGALPAQSVTAPHAALEHNLRPASVTIRLSHEESAQLHQRAAEAGLTVSAYLRSCTFEVDALRAQVKTALAEMRAAAATQKPAQSAPAHRSRWSRIMRFFPRRNFSSLAARP